MAIKTNYLTQVITTAATDLHLKTAKAAVYAPHTAVQSQFQRTVSKNHQRKFTHRDTVIAVPAFVLTTAVTAATAITMAATGATTHATTARVARPNSLFCLNLRKWAQCQLVTTTWPRTRHQRCHRCHSLRWLRIRRRVTLHTLRCAKT